MKSMRYDDLDQFLSEHEDLIETPESKPDRDAVRDMLLSVGIARADDLEQYLVMYGWLAMGGIEFYGMSGNGSSDMRDMTNRLHKTFCMTDGYAALESRGDGFFVMCDGHGRVFLFNTESKSLMDMKIQLREYIMKRFQIELAEAEI